MAIFKQLAQDADIVVENYRPDVKRRLGIDYESLRPINPRLIYGSISGFGQDGPYRDRPGVDQIAQGMGGLMSITGIPGQGPVRVGIPIADLCSGIFLAQGILVALLEREITGEGKWVHTSLLEAMLSMLDFQASRWLMSGEVPPQAGNNHPTGIPTGVFETQGRAHQHRRERRRPLRAVLPRHRAARPAHRRALRHLAGAVDQSGRRSWRS